MFFYAIKTEIRIIRTTDFTIPISSLIKAPTSSPSNTLPPLIANPNDPPVQWQFATNYSDLRNKISVTAALNDKKQTCLEALSTLSDGTSASAINRIDCYPLTFSLNTLVPSKYSGDACIAGTHAMEMLQVIIDLFPFHSINVNETLIYDYL